MRPRVGRKALPRHDGCGRSTPEPPTVGRRNFGPGPEVLTNVNDVNKTNAQWRTELPPEKYAVLREAATEPPFSGELYHNKATGTYHCGACKAVLFKSDAKYESGSGWPSFYKPEDAENVELVEDGSHGMARTEVRCKPCGSHLGHVFDDGPAPTGQRYCINSLALNFEPHTA
jgi:peptide-methionine (R)-S-oxide reductase